MYLNDEILNLLEYILWRENYMFCQLVEGFSLVVLGSRLRGSCWSWGRSTTSRSSRPCCSALMCLSTSSSLFAEQTTSYPRQDWDILKYEVKNNQQATVAKIKTRIFLLTHKMCRSIRWTCTASPALSRSMTPARRELKLWNRYNKILTATIYWINL